MSDFIYLPKWILILREIYKLQQSGESVTITNINLSLIRSGYHSTFSNVSRIISLLEAKKFLSKKVKGRESFIIINVKYKEFVLETNKIMAVLK